METSAQTYPRTVIVAATDCSSASREAMAAAARFSALPGAELHLVYVLDSGDVSRRAEAMGEAEALLREEASMYGLQAASLHLAVGTPAHEIVQLASDLQADVVVVGTHDRTGLQRVILGSVAEQVVKSAPCPVFVARAKRRHEASEGPVIEPPCPKCLAVQQETHGERLWCDQHAERHARGRSHYSMPPGFGGGSNLIRPS